MKPLYLIFTFIFCHTLISFGQNIHVKIASSDIENHDIQMILPVGGSPFYASKMDTVLNKDYKLDLTFNDPEGGLYTLVFANTRYNLFLSPGDRLHIAFSKNEEGKVVPDFEGDNADGHLMYTKFYRPYYQGLAAGYMQEYKTNDKSRDAIFAWMNKDLSMLDSLYGIKKITEDYRELAKASTETYCRSVAAHTLYEDYKAMDIGNDSMVVSQASIDNYVNNWRKIIDGYNFSDKKNFKSEHFFNFIHERNSFLNAIIDVVNLELKQRTTLKTSSYGETLYVINNENTEQSEHKEYILANSLSIGMEQKNYESVLLELFHDFEQQYPESKYLTYLRPGVFAIEQYQDIVSKDFGDGVKFVRGYEEMHDFKQIQEYFKDKLVYIDLWATWCGPCKEEFAFNSRLKKFTSLHGIDVLYISVDRNNADLKWKEMIKYYDLDGYHLRASERMYDQIRELFAKDFNGRQVFSIPHYIILKNGSIVIEDANRPSSEDKLYKQLQIISMTDDDSP